MNHVGHISPNSCSYIPSFQEHVNIMRNYLQVQTYKVRGLQFVCQLYDIDVLLDDGNRIISQLHINCCRVRLRAMQWIVFMAERPRVLDLTNIFKLSLQNNLNTHNIHPEPDQEDNFQQPLHLVLEGQIVFSEIRVQLDLD